MSLELDDVEEGTSQHEPPELPITAMIDIFSMIVIFLLLGGVFGSTNILLPTEMRLPTSFVAADPLVAPQIEWNQGKLTAGFAQAELPEAGLRDSASPAYADFKGKLSAYLAALPPATRDSLKPIHLVADAQTPYEKVFLSVKVLREAGFQNVLLVSSGGRE